MRAVFAAVAIAMVTAILALQATPSAAQKGKKRGGETGMRAAIRKADDKAYKAAIEGLPDKKLDPWRNMR